MNLLVLSTWFPYPPDNGSRLRAFHLLRGLAREHKIRLVAGVQDDLANTVKAGIPSPLSELCREVVPVPWHWYDSRQSSGLGSLLSLAPRSITDVKNPELEAAIRAQLEKPTDAVLVLEMGMSPFLPPQTPPAILEQVETSGPERAFETARGKAQLRNGLTWWKFRRYWHTAFGRYEAITAVSDEEAVAVRRVVGNPTPPVFTIPNGVDVASYRRSPGKAVSGRMIYNGALSYGPNLEAVRWFAEHILPRIVERVPEAHLVVTGRHENLAIEELRKNPKIHLTGFLPDLNDALEQAQVCVVPLRAGGGTRLKILEAFAARLPVVSTTIGAAGIAGQHERHFLLADTPESFANQVVRVLQQPPLTQSLAQNARQLAEERYDWTPIAADLSALLKNVVQNKQ